MSATADRRDLHVSEETLVSLAEGDAPGDEVRRHLESCEACGDRLEATRTILRALACEPPMPDEVTFADRRDRIMHAIDSRRRPASRIHPIRARAGWWVPLAAAAVLAVVFLTRPSPDASGPGRADRAPTSEPSPSGAPGSEASPLPVLAEADRAADEATRELDRAEAPVDGLDDPAADRPRRLDSEAIDLALERLETTDPILSSGSDEDDRLLLEERLAGLSTDEQEAILDDLSAMPLEL